MKKHVYVLATALTLMASGAMATDIAAMSPQERETFGAEIRTYLLENPELIEEAKTVLDERRAGAAQERDARMVADNIEALHGDAMTPMIGDPSAPFTVVKFNDFNCGHCRAVEPDLAAFIEQNPDYKLLIKEFPVLGPNSVIAASFAVTIYELAGSEAYAVVKSRLFGDEGPKGAEYFRDLASEVGVNPDLMTERMGSEEVRAHLQRNVSLAAELEIEGTPGLVFEDVIIRGRVPLEMMGQIRRHIDTRTNKEEK
jgi:protein-disulfide isomerase